MEIGSGEASYNTKECQPGPYQKEGTILKNLLTSVCWSGSARGLISDFVTAGGSSLGPLICA